MNISSLIIRVKEIHAEELIKKLDASGLCECHLYENGKLIVTIEGQDTDEELQKLSSIKRFEEVIAADLIYAYSERELEEARNNIEIAESTPSWLNDDNIDAKSIKYGGDIKSS